ncbi:MAG: hypothetical protein K6L74_17400 [Neptuniibacter sp.]
MIRRVKDIYKLPADFKYQHPALEGIQFANHWCTIKNGCITIEAGYAHDGCSPKYSILELFTVGVPDGRIRQGVPATYYASLVHDVFSQYRRSIPIKKEQVLQIFDDMLRDAKFTPRPLYTALVRAFGPQSYRGDVDQLLGEKS